MSKVAIVCYDLEHVGAFTNSHVKAALGDQLGAKWVQAGLNDLTWFPEWIAIRFPDTTVTLAVNDTVDTRAIAAAVTEVVEACGAKVSKLFVAYIDPATTYAVDDKAMRV